MVGIFLYISIKSKVGLVLPGLLVGSLTLNYAVTGACVCIPEHVQQVGIRSFLLVKTPQNDLLPILCFSLSQLKPEEKMVVHGVLAMKFFSFCNPYSDLKQCKFAR